MNKLHSAYTNGKQVLYQLKVLKPSEQPLRLSKGKYDDLQASILLATLENMPDNEDHKDHKANMDIAQSITHDIMKIIGKELT